MGISRYPRPGCRIAPALLREALAVPLSSPLIPLGHGSVSLCELDESAWARFGLETCQKLGNAVVSQVSSELASGTFYDSSQHLPKPPANLSLEDLQLEVRTYNCLRKLRAHRQLQTPDDWVQLTIGELLDLSAFGAKSLVDFLSSFETSIGFPSGQDKFSPDRAQLIQQENQVLRSWCANPDRNVPPHISCLHLPKPPPGLRLNDLELKNRTYNCLRTTAYENDLQHLGELTVSEILRIPAFGVTSLVDLVKALDKWRPATGCSEPDGQTEMPEAEEETLGKWCNHPTFPLSKEVRRCHLPTPPEGMKLEDLALSERLYGSLEKEGFGARPQDLGKCTIHDIVEISGIGEKGVSELLHCLFKMLGSSKAETSSPLDRSELERGTPQNSVTLEREFRRITTFQQTPQAKRNSRLATRFFGLDGGGGCTLQQAGEEFGITRERVRQISSKIGLRLQKSKPSLPILDSALNFVANSVPGLAETIESNLATQGYAEGKFRLEGLIQAAKIFSRKTSFTIQKMDGQRIAFPPKRFRLARLALRLAISSLSHWGVVTISDIAAQLEEHISTPVDTSFLERTLYQKKGFTWLHQPSGWFWLKCLSKNPLLSKIKKILGVAGRIEISDLRAGVGRPHRMKGFAPPSRVLLELCRQLEFCGVQENCVIATSPIDWRNVLRGAERTMVEVLKEHGPLMQRAKFEEVCAARGITRVTFYAYLQYSPVIDKYANAVYGLRGADVSPDLVQSLIPKNQRAVNVRLDHGWARDGNIFISYRLSKAMLASGCLGIPAALKRFLEGEFKLKAPDGQCTGRLVVKGTSAWGMRSFFGRRGGEEGDILLLQFDLNPKEVIASLGDENLVEQCEPYCNANTR